jgi:two-component system response regulator HydG
MRTDLQDLAGAERVSAVSVLVVDDQAETRDLCSSIIQEAGLKPRVASTTEQALDILEQHPVDLIITDLRVPALGGMELLKRVRDKYPQVSVMVLTQYGSIESAIEAIRLGAADYPCQVVSCGRSSRQAETTGSLPGPRSGKPRLARAASHPPGIWPPGGRLASHAAHLPAIEKVSQHNHSVLLLGESGTGKEMIARSIHFMGPRQTKAFCPVDCSSLVSTLIESELFGYVKGAFTGATASKMGLLEAANGGTLFLDEIGDMPVDLQAKLLRVLQEKEVKRVGSTERVSLSIRVIAATNRDLEAAVRSGAFRQDLYFRLNVVQIKLPPLRERRTDIPLLINTFLDKFSEPQRRPLSISADAMVR